MYQLERLRARVKKYSDNTVNNLGPMSTYVGSQRQRPRCSTLVSSH